MDCSKLTEDGTPELGMEFNSEEDAYKFYKKYAFKMGFSVSKNYLNKDKDSVTTSRRYSCCKEGVKRKYKGDVMPKRTRAPTKTGCGAKMVIILFRGTMKYCVHDLVLERNHELHITQCAHMMPSQRKVSVAQGFQGEISEDAGFSMKQSHELMGKEAGGMGNVDYTRDDLKRYLRTRRERSLKYGEAGSMINYFQEQTLENPSFFHAVQLDCEEEITNIFWTDTGMLIDYNFFGDVVTFDTTYKKNKEYRLLGVFVGFNQHRQIVIFGAHIMYDETIDFFKWVFGTFLEAMYGKRPSTILTDQDHAMAAALSVVMPETFHSLCTFHIRRNFMKHLGNHCKENSDLLYIFGACIYEFEEVEQFNRFFRHFNRVVDEKRHNELIAEYEMRQKLPMVGLRQTPMFVHASETYSPTIFVTFQNKYGESTAMIILRQQDAAMFMEFTVMRYDGGPERIVVFNRNDLSMRCSCKKYENEGILYGHALKVFDTVGIKIIPPEYVKKRWTKRARVGDCFDRQGWEVVADPKIMISTRYREFAPTMIKVATRAAMSEDTSKVAITVISDLAKRIELLLSESEEQPLQNEKNLNMEERDKIEIVNEMEEAVVVRGLRIGADIGFICRIHVYGMSFMCWRLMILLCRMDVPSGSRVRSIAKQGRGVLPMIKYQIRPRGATLRWSPASRFRRCECRHKFAYPNTLVFAVDKERKELAKDYAKIEAEVKQLREANKRQAERIKELEYDLSEGQDRVDDLCTQLGEMRKRMTKRARQLRENAGTMLNLCEDLLGDESVESSSVGGGVGSEPSQANRSSSPTVG
nr:protein FAR1-RELATED SEQUENCE 5-like [Coffea arabica]